MLDFKSQVIHTERDFCPLLCFCVFRTSLLLLRAMGCSWTKQDDGETLSLTRREMQVILAYSLDMLWFACPSETAQKTCATVGKHGSRYPDSLLGHLGEHGPMDKQLGRSVTSAQTQQFQSQGFFLQKH